MPPRTVAAAPARLIPLFAAVLLLGVAPAQASGPVGAASISPGHEQQIADLVLGPEAGRAGQPYQVESVNIATTTIVVSLSSPAGDLAIFARGTTPAPTAQTPSFDLLWQPRDGAAPPPTELVEGIRARDPGRFWRTISAPLPPIAAPDGRRKPSDLRPVDAATLRSLLADESLPWPEIPGRFELVDATLHDDHAQLEWRLAGEVPVTVGLFAREASRAAVRELPSFRVTRGAGEGWTELEVAPFREEALEELYARIEASDTGMLTFAAPADPEPVGPSIAQGPARHDVPRGWFLPLAWLGAFAFFAALLAPWLAPLKSLTGEAAPGLPRRVAELAAVAGLVASVAWSGWTRTASELQLTAEHESFFTLAALCEAGLGCPAVGQPMGSLQVPLGPLFFQLLVLVGRLAPAPEGLFALIGVGHALATGLLTLLVRRLCGLPFGLLAGALLGFSPSLLALEATPTHAALTPLPLVGLAWAGVSWLQGGGGRPLALACVALAVSLQLHGITLLSGFALLAAAALVRPPTPPRALAVGLLAALALFATWLQQAFDSGFAWFRSASSPQAYADDAPISLALLTKLLGPTSWALVLAGLVTAALLLLRTRDATRRATLLPAALLVLVPLAVAVGARSRWNDRYLVAFVPGLELAAALGAWGAWRFFAATRARGARVVGILAPLALFAPLAWPTLALLEPLPSTWPLPIGVQRAIAGALDRHGHYPVALETRVHGELWNRADIGTSLVAPARDRSPTASPPRHDPREHVLVTDGPCTRLPPDFAQWEERVQADGRAFTVAGYVPALAVPTLTVSGGTGPGLVQAATLPIYEFDGNSWHRGPLARLFPSLAPALSRRPLVEALARGEPGTTLEIGTTFEAGADDRVLALRSDPDDEIELRLGSSEALAPDSISQRTRTVTRRWVLPASRRTAPLDVAVTVHRKGRQPGFELDLFEEPGAGCAKSPKT
jgi:hypothetical protein